MTFLERVQQNQSSCHRDRKIQIFYGPSYNPLGSVNFFFFKKSTINRLLYHKTEIYTEMYYLCKLLCPLLNWKNVLHLKAALNLWGNYKMYACQLYKTC